MKITFIPKYIILLTLINIYTYANIRDNFNILDSMVIDASQKILHHINSKNYKEILIKHNINPVISLFTKQLFNNSDKIKFFYKSTNNLPELTLEILNSNISYEIYEPSNDSLYRIIELKINAYIKTLEGQYININLKDYYYKDIISRQDINFIQSMHSELTTASIPELKQTFFEEVTEPLIIITGAIITVILLFTIRSS